MQDIVVLLVGVVVFGSMGWKVYKLITRQPKPNAKCGGCSGCVLKEKSNCVI